MITKCFAFHIATGQRCPHPVGSSPRSQYYKLCVTHSQSGYLIFRSSMISDRERVAQEQWDLVIQGAPPTADMLRGVRAGCAAWPPAVIELVALEAEMVPFTGNHEQWINTVIPRILPIMQEHVDTERKQLDAQIAATNAFIAESDARLAFLRAPTRNVH